jgi:hypothetical protein
MDAIDTLNMMKDGVEYGINKWAAHTPEEYRAAIKGLSVAPGHSAVDQCPGPDAPALPTDNLPASLDWREHNMTTPVKVRTKTSISPLFPPPTSNLLEDS